VSDGHDFDDFYRGTRQRLVGFVYVMTGDLAEAQDVVHEAFVRAWQRWSTVGRYEDPESWVRVVATRLAISRWRGLRSRIRAHVRHGPPAPVAAPSTETLEIVEALRRLPEAQRRALALHYLFGLSVAETARETGVPVGTVKARLSRGRATLAKLLTDEPEGAVS
jgi:RNA polymerase sigma-70 factor (ECF subfamily)